MFIEILLIILSFLLVIIGGLGVILPFLPGVPLAWLGLLLFGFATTFVDITWKIIFIFLGFTILTLIFDLIGPILGAKRYNASRYGVIGAALGLLVGIFTIGPLGIIVGPFLGAIFGELWHGKMWDEAMQSATGALIGILIGSAIKFALILVMLGFLVAALF